MSASQDPTSAPPAVAPAPMPALAPGENLMASLPVLMDDSTKWAWHVSCHPTSFEAKRKDGFITIRGTRAEDEVKLQYEPGRGVPLGGPLGHLPTHVGLHDSATVAQLLQQLSMLALCEGIRCRDVPVGLFQPNQELRLRGRQKNDPFATVQSVSEEKFGRVTVLLRAPDCSMVVITPPKPQGRRGRPQVPRCDACRTSQSRTVRYVQTAAKRAEEEQSAATAGTADEDEESAEPQRKRARMEAVTALGLPAILANDPAAAAAALPFMFGAGAFPMPFGIPPGVMAASGAPTTTTATASSSEEGGSSSSSSADTSAASAAAVAAAAAAAAAAATSHVGGDSTDHTAPTLPPGMVPLPMFPLPMLSLLPRPAPRKEGEGSSAGEGARSEGEAGAAASAGSSAATASGATSSGATTLAPAGVPPIFPQPTVADWQRMVQLWQAAMRAQMHVQQLQQIARPKRTQGEGGEEAATSTAPAGDADAAGSEASAAAVPTAAVAAAQAAAAAASAAAAAAAAAGSTPFSAPPSSQPPSSVLSPHTTLASPLPVPSAHGASLTLLRTTQPAAPAGASSSSN